jgi:hypothetical protein
VVALLLFNCGNVMAQPQQAHVHGMSHSVMPFDIAKTAHIFKMIASSCEPRQKKRETRPQ